MTCYQPDSSKTLSERGCIGFTFSPSNCFYWGAAAPQTPCCSWGASSPPDPLAGGLQPPVPPCIPRGSASRALRRSWYRDLGTRILVPRSRYQDPGTKLGTKIWLVTRILVPGSWYQHLGNRILVSRSWYQDLAIRILVPRSWYQDLGTKILVPRS